MSILAWLGLTPPPDNVTVATQTWLAADRDARAEVSAREQLTAWQCRAAAARLELRERNRMYGRASATIGAQRDTIARLRGDLTALSGPCRDTARARTGVGLDCVLGGGHQLPHSDRDGLMWGAADEALAAAMRRHPAGTADPADTAKVGDSDLSWRDDDATCCKAVRDSRWACTRSEGHRGQHVAGGGKVHAVWPNDDADTALVATAERLGDEIGPGRTAAIEGAAITLRAHQRSFARFDACSCGWSERGVTHVRHVAEQLAAVGALAGTTPRFALDPGGKIPVRIYGTTLDGTWTGHLVDADGSPIVEIEPVIERAKAAT